MTLSLSLTNQNGDALTIPVSPSELEFSTSQRGYAGLRANYPLNTRDAFNLYNTGGMIRARVHDDTWREVWDGRIEDFALDQGGVQLTGFGHWRALGDVPYTALWTRATSAGWRLQTNDDVASGFASDTASQRYTIDNNNRIYIAPSHGETVGTQRRGAIVYELPDGGERFLTDVEFDYILDSRLPLQGDFDQEQPYQLDWRGYDDDWEIVDFGTVAFTSTNNGWLISGSYSDTILTGATKLAIHLFHRSVAGVQYTGDTGQTYARLTNIRFKTTASATVQIGEIAQDLVDYIDGINPDAISTAVVNNYAGALDFRNELYEDALPSDILETLARAVGCHVSIWDGKRLVITPYGTGGQNYFVDVTGAIKLQRSLNDLFTEGYAKYKDDNGRILRTHTAPASGFGVNSAGMVRRGFIGADTTSLAQAEVERDAWLSDRNFYAIRVDLEVERVYNESGAEVPLYALRSHDTLTIRNLSPILGGAVDAVRSFRIGRTNYNAVTDSIDIEPDSPVPTLVTLISQREANR